MHATPSDHEDVDDEDGWEADQSTCPYCSSGDGSCEHLLLLVDLHWRTPEGGFLSDAFSRRWANLNEAAEDDFDVDAAFQKLLDEVESLADFSSTSNPPDPGPGFSSTYRAYWVSYGEKAVEALDRFLSGFPHDAEPGLNRGPVRILNVYEYGAVDSWSWEAWLSGTPAGSYSAELFQVVDEAADDGAGGTYELPSFRTGQELFEFLESSWRTDHEEPLEEIHWSEIIESIRPVDAALANEIDAARQRALYEAEKERPNPTALELCVAGARWERTKHSGGGAMWAALGESQRGRAAISTFVREFFEAHHKLPSGAHRVRVDSGHMGVFDKLVQFPAPD